MTGRTLLVGSDTDEAGTDGLLAFGLDGDRVVRGEALRIPSPTYLAAHPTRPLVLAVSETNDSRLHSFALDRTRFPAALLPLGDVATGGSGACHVAVAPGGDFALVAHYGSGSVSCHPILDAGRVGDAAATLAWSGGGPIPDRQDASHAHQVLLDGDIVLVPDLGTDRLHRLLLGPDGSLHELEPLVLPSGFGPRHAVLHEDRLYVLGELAGRLWVGDRDGAGFREAGTVPVTRAAASYPSAIRVVGQGLLVGNRGPDTLALLTLAGALPELVCEFPVGPWPRDFATDGDLLWVAHQRGGGVGRYRLADPDAGAELELPAPSPACVIPV